MNLQLAATTFFALAFSALHADPAPANTNAADLAAKMSALRQDGASFIRLRMEIKQGGASKGVLQIQIKSRQTKAGTDVVYQILFPKERKGEAVRLHKSGDSAITGSSFTPPDNVRPIDASQAKEPLFGSDLSYEDVVDDFFAWDQQAIVGTEQIGRTECVVLESKPGKGERSSYSSVKSWIDARRLVPLSIEKYRGGQMVRRIDTNDTVKDGDRYIPAFLTVRSGRGDSTTVLDGSKIRHDVTYGEGDFAAEALKNLNPPR